MKITLKDLQQLSSISDTYDYHHEIEHIADILDIKPAKIYAQITWGDDDLVLDVTIDVMLTLACAKTLKPVDYPLHVNEKIIFGNHEDADFILEDPLPLKDIIFGYVMSEKPLVIYHPDAQKLTFEKQKSPHPAFADLDKFLKT